MSVVFTILFLVATINIYWKILDYIKSLCSPKYSFIKCYETIQTSQDFKTQKARDILKKERKCPKQVKWGVRKS